MAERIIIGLLALVAGCAIGWILGDIAGRLTVSILRRVRPEWMKRG